MQLQPEERAILAAIAEQRGVEAHALLAAVEAESAPDLAQALDISVEEADAKLAPLLRVVTVSDDWGAGCRLLTDEMRVELRHALRTLAPEQGVDAT